MSLENIVRFMERVVNDKQFGDEIGSLDGDGGPESVRRLIDIAEQAGYTFTEAELDELFRVIVQRSAGELRDEQLENVAGGASTDAGVSPSLPMQYSSLQEKMQDENRRFTLLSNVMKTKHDTAKNSISNVR